MRLVGFTNDCRTVDLPGLPVGKETGDAWLGVYKSLDGGMTWRSTLLPGYPQNAGSQSPIHGYEAGADPVVRAGTHGLFYLTGIVFDRGDPARSALFMTRYMDLDNRESGDPMPESAYGTFAIGILGLYGRVFAQTDNQEPGPDDDYLIKAFGCGSLQNAVDVLGAGVE